MGRKKKEKKKDKRQKKGGGEKSIEMMKEWSNDKWNHRRIGVPSLKTERLLDESWLE